MAVLYTKINIFGTPPFSSEIKAIVSKTSAVEANWGSKLNHKARCALRNPEKVLDTTGFQGGDDRCGYRNMRCKMPLTLTLTGTVRLRYRYTALNHAVCHNMVPDRKLPSTKPVLWALRSAV